MFGESSVENAARELDRRLANAALNALVGVVESVDTTETVVEGASEALATATEAVTETWMKVGGNSEQIPLLSLPPGGKVELQR